MPNAIQRFGSAIKSLVWPGGFYGPGRDVGTRGPDFIPYDESGRVINLRLSDPDEACAGPPWENSATAIALNWIVSNFPEADLVIEERDAKGEWTRREDDPMVALLDDPAPSFGAYDFHSVWAGALLGCLLDGNAYWYKARDQAGAVKELWSLPHYRVEPVRRSPSSPDYLYRYRVPIEGRPDYVEDFDPSEIVHFKWGIPDACNDLKSVAPHKRCIQERMTDTEGAKYTSAILANRGVPGLVVVFEPQPGVPFTTDDANAVRDGLDASFTGRGRGSTKVLKGPLKLESPSFKPSELALNEISRIPEARLCAALGVPPMVLGLSVGDAQKTYSNLAEAERQAWRKLRSVQNRMAEALYRQLLPDFAEDRTALRVAWDYSRVEALQEDRDAVAKRSVMVFQAGGVDRARFKAMIGETPLPEDEGVYWTSQNPNEGATLAEPAPLRIAKGLDLDTKAASLLDRLEARLDADDAAVGGGADPGLDPPPPVASPPQILDARGRPLGAKGQPARPALWEADRIADEADLPPDGDGDEGLAGDATSGDAPDDPAKPDASHQAPGEGPGPADPALPRGGGPVDPGGVGADLGLEPGPPGE